MKNKDDTAKPFYITTPIYYPNASLHLGHAYTNILADAFARYHRLMGRETFFLSGTDDHSIQVAKAAEKAGVDPKVFVKEKGEEFKNLYKKLNVVPDDFIQTSDEKKHWPGAIELWNRINANGDLEKRKYSGLYCPGCEAFKKEEELVDGKCPDHDIVPDFVEEENYFFKLSKYNAILEEKITSREIDIIPETRRNEILALIKRGLEDVSFSRPKRSIVWGIPVPGDSEQTMYVWCDALSNYISALGFGTNDDSKFKTFWPSATHLLGKDILRFHAAIWPAMLISAGLSTPKTILAHGMIISGGRKMSKTLGNVINPLDIVRDYGTDPLRYYLAGEVSPFDDGEFTMERFKDVYNGKLANGLGNLTSRIMKMATTHLDGPPEIPEKSIPEDWKAAMERFDIKGAMDIVFRHVGELDATIQSKEPYKLVKTDKEAAIEIIKELVIRLYTIGRMLNPVMPETNVKIKETIKSHKMPDPLFLRKD